MRVSSAFWRATAILAVPIFCLLPDTSRAQQSKDPDLAYAYPAGGRKGTAIDVTVGGQYLAGATGGIVSGSGVQVAITGYSRPLPRKRFNDFRDALAEKRKQMAASMPAGTGKKERPPDLEQTLREAGATDDEIRLFRIEQKQRNDPKRQDNKQLVETVTLRLEIAPDAAKGPRALRLFGKNGLSNPLAFLIGDYPEQCAPGATEPRRESPAKIDFPAVLNGQILPGQSDAYLFHADKGERLVFVAQARDLIPYLADAVPGWFQPVMTIYDSDGGEMASAQSGRFAPDPVLLFEVKKSGDYRLEIRDALRRGREDFVYRVTAGSIPFVTGIYPLGGRPDTGANVELSGWNLPCRTSAFQVPADAGIHPVPQVANGFATMDVSFESDPAPETGAAEPDDDIAHAQKVGVPSTIDGRVETPGDVDVFAVNCKKGEPLVVEVFARRLNSPLDSFVRVTDSGGKQLAYNDDADDKESALLTHHADSRLEFVPPSDGLFYVHLGDAQRQGGPEFAYRLHLSRPHPDFALRVVPSGISGSPGASVPVTVYAMRKDGFAGDIRLSAATGGFVLSGGIIPAGSDSVTATLTFPDSPKGAPEPVEITGTADTPGGKLTHKVVPADDMLQAFFYHHLVPTTEFLAYTLPGTSKKSVQLVPGTVKISASDAGRAKVLVPKSMSDLTVQAELRNPPEGFWIEGVSPCQEGVEIAIRADPKKTKPGTRGNLIVELIATKAAVEGDKPQASKRWSLGLLPAISYELARN